MSLGACAATAQLPISVRGHLDSGQVAEGGAEEGAAPAPTDAPADPVATEAPAEPEAPAPTAAAPEPTAPGATVPDAETSDDGNDWLLPVLVIGGLLLIAVAVGGALSRSRQPKQPATAGARTDPGDTVSAGEPAQHSQWIADHLTLELMAASPAAALQRWSVERSRLDNVAIGARQQFLDARDPNWQPLSQSMSELAASIDTALALRAQDPPNAQLINDSIDVVNGHRARLRQLVAVLLPTIAT